MNDACRFVLLAGLTCLGLSSPAGADSFWTPLDADPALWPYADGPTVQTVALPNSVYRMAGVVGTYEGEDAIFSVGGRTRTTYYVGETGTSEPYPDNRQSHFSIFRPGTGWLSADGSDDVDNGNGTWTSVGLAGYNNGSGTQSPTAGQGTGYVADQGFLYGNAMYVFGGYPQWGGQMARYDLAGNRWSQVALGDDDGLYTNGGGGLIGDRWYKVHRAGALMCYNPTADAFEADVVVPGLVDPGFGAGTGVIDDLLYLLDIDGSLYAIDPAGGSVVKKATAPLAVREAGTVVWGGKLFILGGKTDSSNVTSVDRIQIYDPQTDAWGFSIVTLPSARSGMLAEVLGETLYVGNGLNDLDGDSLAVLNDFYAASMQDVSTPIPEPAGVSLLALGALAILRRRTV